MKATPQELKVMQRMQPGMITLSGFLGDDTRTLNEIVADDAATLSRLGRSCEEIADRMQFFTEKSWDSFVGGILLDEIYQVETEVVRGRLPCPYAHSGIYRKAVTTFTNTRDNITLRWSTLNIHLIREHGFFEGKGSVFRLDPETLVRALF